jgi:phosphatidylglycerol lysyltransferase
LSGFPDLPPRVSGDRGVRALDPFTARTGVRPPEQASLTRPVFPTVVALSGNATEDRARRHAERIVECHGRSSLDYFKLLPDKTIFLSRDASAFLAYGKSLGVTVVLGDPVGPQERIRDLLSNFIDHFEGHGRSVAFLQAGSEFLDLYRAHGLSPVHIGSDAVVDLARFDLAEPRSKPLRYALRKTSHEGLVLRHLRPPLHPTRLKQLQETNSAWLSLPGRIERGFSVGRFRERIIRHCPVSLLERPDGRVAAFANWIPSFVSGEATIDLIRRRPDAPNGAVDALITEILLHARAKGFSRFDLGLAPLGDIRPVRTSHPAERVLEFISTQTEFLHPHRRLYRWKAKFHPRWEPRWLLYRGGPLAFARAAYAVRRIVRF